MYGTIAVMSEKNDLPKSGMFSNILAVAGLVVLIAIIVWGLSYVVSFSKSWISSFPSFFRPSSSIKVTAPLGKIPSGEEFPISWRYAPRSAGTYAFLYECQEGVQFKTTILKGLQAVIPCGIGYSMLSDNNSFAAIPFLSGTSSLAVPFSIIFMSNAPIVPGETVSQPNGSATVTVIAAETPVESTGRISATVMTSVAPESVSATEPMQAENHAILPVTNNADLSVKILSVGVIDPVSGAIIPRRPASANDIAAVRFLISNEGGIYTGEWHFTANLPTVPATPYTSPVQKSLAPKDSIENTLRFNNAIPNEIFSVTVDPANKVVESDETNNTASVNI
jgi:hypothetical protein